MKKTLLLSLLVCLAAVGTTPRVAQAQAPAQTPARPAEKEPEHPTDWTHWVRIGGFGLRSDAQADDIVRKATESNVFGIEVDNDIPGRYESFLDPTAKLKAIHAVAEAAHKVGNRAFVYIAGTECITANADKAPHSVMKDHPDWVQRKVTGEPASFTGGAAFWIRKGDEDVWISPYAEPWRHTYMERVRQIAATGIDGIYVDIPYWMTHFDGWEKTWASFDDFTVAAFKKKTGLDAKKDLKIGDFSDANFRKWVDFRIDTLTDFMAEIRSSARSVKPDIMVIPEIYPGIEEEATRVGADVYEMYAVTDAIAHEYEFGNGEHMASGRSQIDWFLYQAGMLTFRGFAQGKATWILNYSWDGDKVVDKREAMKNLAMSQVVTGSNFWDAPGHSMGGSNDIPTRRLIFDWIAANEKTLYSPRTPIEPVGVYFSNKSRDYDAAEFLPSYRGTLVALLQAHREFQVVTPRTLGEFQRQDARSSQRNHVERHRKGPAHCVLEKRRPPRRHRRRCHRNARVRLDRALQRMPGQSVLRRVGKRLSIRVPEAANRIPRIHGRESPNRSRCAANRRRKHFASRWHASHLPRQLHRPRPRQNRQPDARQRHPNPRARFERQHARIFAVSRRNSDAPRHAKGRADRVHSAAGGTRRNRLDDWKIAVGIN